MSHMAEPDFVTQQYRDGAKLQARIALHSRFSTNPVGLSTWVWDQLNVPPNAHILEVGCGSGALWQANRARMSPGWHVTLTDLSPGMIAEVTRTMPTLPGTIVCQVADVQELPFDDGSFDAVLAMHMLYHVPDRQRAYRELRRVLRPGGRLYASTNGATHMHQLHELAHQFGMKTMWDGGPHGVFLLETGEEELGPWFTTVEVRRYESNVVVDQAEPLADFLLSMSNEGHAVATRTALVDRLQALIDTRGPMHIAKDTGMLIAGDA